MYKKYLILLKYFIRNSIMRDMEFRINIITNMVTDFIFNALKILFIQLIYMNTVEIAGFDKYEMLFLFGTSFIILSIYMLFIFFNHIQIPAVVQSGELDLILVKPISPIFMLSLRYFNIAGGGSAVLGAYLVVYSAAHMHIQFSILNLFLYFVLVICGFIVYYSIALILFTLSFWTIKTSGFINTLVDIGEVMKYPHTMFPGVIQFVLSFIFPLFMVVTYPAEIVLGKIPVYFSAVNILISIVIFIIAIKYNRFALKRYTSASS